MNTTEFLSTLTNYCDYIVGTSQMVISKGKTYKDGKKIKADTDAPEGGGYPVVVALKESTTVCDWCCQEVACPNLKSFSKPFQSSPVWNAKCQTCGEKRIIKPEE